MPVELSTFNQVLDTLLKIVGLITLIVLTLFLKHSDKVVTSVEKSAESMERTTETVEDLAGLARSLPFVGEQRDE